MPPSNPIQTFLHEADDLLAKIEEIALAMDETSANADEVNQLFRAFHTIKGSGAMFGFDEVADFTHHVETALDLARDGKLPISQPLLDCVLAAKDHIKALLDASQGDASARPTNGAAIIASVAALCGAPADASASVVTPASPILSAASPIALAPTQGWKIRFRPSPDLLTCGGSPSALLDELRALGECQVSADAARVPTLDALTPEHCYLTWDIRLRTSADFNAIKDVFIFVEDGAELSIQQEKTPEPASPVGTPSSVKPVSVVSRQPAPAAANAQPLSAAASPRPAAADANAAPARKSPSKDSLVRVPSEKLDRLVGLVGELVMNQSRLNQVSQRLDQPDLSFPVEELERLIGELRDTVLGIRMMPIGSTFGRFNRLVHDLSRELDKDINLVTHGAETELDKTVLDRLGDPLVHLIRNSIDHGIEPAHVRLEMGKPAQGTIRLSAVHAGSNVMVTIEDDGKGLDRDAIRRKAIEKGLIPPDTALADREIYNLIFLPGFSTAKEVTNVSGRGVGMDVVKRQIEALRGSVSLASKVGVGTTITLSLPLTLAIVDGLVVAVGEDQFVIPTAVVTENVELAQGERDRFNGRHVVAVRGELVPFISLREVFTVPGEPPPLEKVVIVQQAGERVGLVVDRVLGSHQTVIQALGRFYRDIEVLSGATIMGDGRVALILDVAGLVRFTDPHSSPSLSTR